MPKPVIAIIGRPNVGKSMLFNKLVGRRAAIVEDTPGVTRDRNMAACEWRGREVTLVDTGGIEPRDAGELQRYIREQARLAIDAADAVILVCDVKTGITDTDAEVALILQRAKKPVAVAVNKCDRTGAGAEADIYEFYGLGLGDPTAVSALHGIGTGDLLDACYALLPPETAEAPEPDVIRVAITGKPNAGKSSLTNALLGEQRVIVSDVPGTTRDAIDAHLENEHGRFLIIDTAGMRKKARVHERVEYFSVLRAVMAIERADVCVILLDARDGVTEQDTKVAGLAHDAGKACVIAVNKWDLIDKDTHTLYTTRERVRAELPFMAYAPVEFISAKTGQRVDTLLKTVAKAAASAAARVTTGMLNDVLADAVARVQPPSDKGRRLKIYYMTQADVKPPRFVAFVNDDTLFHFSYRRYLENRIRETFGFEGTPILLEAREKKTRAGR